MTSGLRHRTGARSALFLISEFEPHHLVTHPPFKLVGGRPGVSDAWAPLPTGLCAKEDVQYRRETIQEKTLDTSAVSRLGWLWILAGPQGKKAHRRQGLRDPHLPSSMLLQLAPLALKAAGFGFLPARSDFRSLPIGQRQSNICLSRISQGELASLDCTTDRSFLVVC
jgi:hypothetical protein